MTSSTFLWSWRNQWWSGCSERMRSENILIFLKRNTGIKNIRLIDGLTTCVVERHVQVEQILYNGAVLRSRSFFGRHNTFKITLGKLGLLLFRYLLSKAFTVLRTVQKNKLVGQSAPPKKHASGYATTATLHERCTAGR